MMFSMRRDISNPAKPPVWVEFRGKRIGITICEDAWNVPDFLPGPLYHVDPICELRKASVDLIINLSASPYHVGKAPLGRRTIERTGSCAPAVR